MVVARASDWTDPTGDQSGSTVESARPIGPGSLLYESYGDRLRRQRGVSRKPPPLVMTRRLLAPMSTARVPAAFSTPTVA